MAITVSTFGQQNPEAAPSGAHDDLLWKKLSDRVAEIVERFDGVMGVTIVDLTDNRTILKNADRVFPTASSIKIAILLELYHQDQDARTGVAGKAKLDDVYTFDPKDLVEDSQILAGLTPGVTRVTNRDLAQFMVAVSDNAAANILIVRVGRENVNAMLRGLGLAKTMLRRKMMDVAAARRGEENISTPPEIVRLLEAIYKGKALDKELTAAFIKQLSTLKESYIPRELPAVFRWPTSPQLGRCADGLRHCFCEEPAICDECDDGLRPRRARGRTRDQRDCARCVLLLRDARQNIRLRTDNGREQEVAVYAQDYAVPRRAEVRPLSSDWSIEAVQGRNTVIFLENRGFGRYRAASSSICFRIFFGLNFNEPFDPVVSPRRPSANDLISLPLTLLRLITRSS